MPTAYDEKGKPVQIGYDEKGQPVRLSSLGTRMRPHETVPGTAMKFAPPDIAPAASAMDALGEAAPVMLSLAGPMAAGATGVVGTIERAVSSPTGGALLGGVEGYRRGGLPGALEGAALGFAGVKTAHGLGKLIGALRSAAPEVAAGTA